MNIPIPDCQWWITSLESIKNNRTAVAKINPQLTAGIADVYESQVATIEAALILLREDKKSEALARLFGN